MIVTISPSGKVTPAPVTCVTLRNSHALSCGEQVYTFVPELSEVDGPSHVHTNKDRRSKRHRPVLYKITCPTRSVWEGQDTLNIIYNI